MVLDSETGRFVDANARALRLFGLGRERLLQQGPAQVSPTHQPDGRRSDDAAREYVIQALEGGSPRFEWTHQDQQGRPLPCEVRLVRFPDRERSLVCGTISDISHHKAAEEELSRRERHFRRLIEQGWDVVCQIDAELNLVEVSSPASRLYGTIPEETIGRSVLRTLHPDDRASAREQLERVRATPASSSLFTVRLIDGQGASHWMEVVATNLLDDPDVTAIVANCRDVTERRRAELEVEAGRTRLQLAMDGGGVGLWEWWVKTGEVTWSEQTARIFGIAPGDFGGTVEHYRALIHPDDRGATGHDIETALHTNEPYETEHRILRSDGSLRWIEARGRVLSDATGQPERMIGTARDVTEARLAEERLLAAEALYRTLFEELPDAALVLDARTLVPIRLNSRAVELLGGDREQLLRESLLDLIAEGSKMAFAGACAARGLTSAEDSQLEIEPRSGPRRRVRMSLEHILLEGREVLHVVLRDVTAQLAAEAELRDRKEQLWHAQRMDAIGRLASGVAHDFNNLLTIISGYTELARLAIDEQDPAREALDTVLEAARDAEGVAKALLTFSRLPGSEATPVDLTEVVERTGRLLHRTLPASIAIEVDTSAAVDARVLGNADQLGQVLMNLAINARDAMPDGGELRCTLETLDDEVVLRIHDDGPGIAPELHARIFEPYFTTKPRGKGTGLGLSILHGIVSGHGGRVEVESEPGQGTTFSVWLPRLVGPHPRSKSNVKLPRTGGVLHGRVLLAEDNRRLSELAQRTLRECGLEVDAVQAGDRALAEVLAAPDRFDALILDHDLPGMVGADCVASLRAAGQQLPVLIITGAPEFELDERIPAAALLRKPFQPGDLVAAVAALLERGATSESD
ncbi:Sensor protein FixL [Planctomycetes bacterium Pla86]|uniref:histidine kinase n=1 Tax=Engelhardtia mirabilis TaxID=2528011 RepID=A0A518BGE7_9BACT|nr:Sensor protein FixL [Planctomycetes bacterium Pla133]QDV00357.1 Sensor protein FixL [Planctomycetes bacterium Pla86]